MRRYLHLVLGVFVHVVPMLLFGRLSGLIVMVVLVVGAVACIRISSIDQ